jgi:predicted AlkP superfamily pyrophosphatase or phosphodiesterase
MYRLAWALTGLLAVFASLVGAQQSPRLVVIVVVDQFRADYLTTFASHWRAGFKTLLSEGAVFERAAYPYLHTDTCAGHVTIATGAFPRTHGMWSDAWFDAGSQRNIECTDDEKAPIVSYGRPAKLGKSGRRNLVPTLADTMRADRAGTRVVTLSMKARSAIGLAGQGGDAVTWFDEVPGVMSFMTSAAFAAAPVPAVQTFLKKFPIETEVGRSWALREPASAYTFRDAGLGERPPLPWTGLFPHDIKGATADASLGLWRASPFSDAYLGRMAAWMVDEFQLGQRDATDFLGIGFSATDVVGHSFGPGSREVEDTVARLDDTLGALIAHLDARVGRGRYVLALSADHGVGHPPVAKGANKVATEDVRERIEETLIERFGPRSSRYVLGGTDFLRLAEGVMAKLAADPAAMRAIEETVMDIPGIDRILRVDQLSVASPDPLVRAAALSHYPGRTGDLVVVTEPHWQLAGRAVGGSTHGSPYDYDQRVPVILFGAGIRAGRYSQTATPADIAPTLAHLAGVALPKAEGRVLKEGLR